jgi:hypothetical protein
MTKMAFAFLFFLSNYWRPFQQRADGLLDLLFSLHPKDSGVLTFDGTLVLNDCMEWANIPRWGDYRLGWHGQKIPFPFLGSTVPLVGI